MHFVSISAAGFRSLFAAYVFFFACNNLLSTPVVCRDIEALLKKIHAKNDET